MPGRWSTNEVDIFDNQVLPAENVNREIARHVDGKIIDDRVVAFVGVDAVRRLVLQNETLYRPSLRFLQFESERSAILAVNRNRP